MMASFITTGSPEIFIDYSLVDGRITELEIDGECLYDELALISEPGWKEKLMAWALPCSKQLENTAWFQWLKDQFVDAPTKPNDERLAELMTDTAALLETLEDAQDFSGTHDRQIRQLKSARHRGMCAQLDKTEERDSKIAEAVKELEQWQM
jgi:hypothetical protein